MGALVKLVANPHRIEIQEWPFVFAVPSETDPKKIYRVDVDALRCTCRAGINRRACKHVRWACEVWESCAKVSYRRMMQGEAGWKLLHQLEYLATIET